MSASPFVFVKGRVGMQAERTFSIGERAGDLMRSYCESASPHSYEVWFTYVSGVNPALSDAVKRRLEQRPRLTVEDVDALHTAHLSTSRLRSEAEAAGAGMIGEIEQVMGLIGSALTSNARYDASLRELTADLAESEPHGNLRGIIESLVVATREVATTNRALETSLNDSRGEIHNLRATLEAVRMETLIDPLTGIANRKHFEHTLVTAVDQARAASTALALIVIDIDNFKHFNDVFGHLTGDQVLRLVSAAMREHVDPTATLARFGGEEFAIILPGASSEQAYACAETVRRNVEGRELVKRSTSESLGRITISLGVAVMNEGDGATSLLERADQCMYRAKNTGRNRTVTDAIRIVASAA